MVIGVFALQDAKPYASKGDVDLRALPVVHAPSRSETDSSDSDAEVLATLQQRRHRRNKIVEGTKSLLAATCYRKWLICF